MPLNESIVKDGLMTWFGELGYAVGHGSHLAPGEYAKGTLTRPLPSAISAALRFPGGGGQEQLFGSTGGFKFQREGRRRHEAETGA